MCGINGLVSNKTPAVRREEIVLKMNRTLAHRGPDNDGIWSGEDITLGHRRLSIIDLSAECNQPFISGDGRYVLVYNGELYNYQELKLELQRAAFGKQEPVYFFRTNSDTEVVLAAFIRWGAGCLDRFNGMYAFAIYDKQLRKLFVARDRLGVKPLYYHYGTEGFIFSSEVRPLIHSGLKQFSLNREALPEYTMYQTVHAPNTIVKGLKVLMPGHYMEFESDRLTITRYYELHVKTELADGLDYKETCRRIFELLSHSVQRRLVADVPFGAFLSGGIDSSIIVGLMSQLSTQKVRTFNVNFDEGEFSEAHYARMIAKKFNTEHHEIRLTPGDFLKDLPDALRAIDHPGGDGPNTFVVSKATKEAGITMALSGVGGDELFAGYDVFRRMDALSRRPWLNVVPGFARKIGAGMIRGRSTSSKKVAELLSQPEISFESAYPLNRSLFTYRDLKKLIQGDPYITVREILSGVPKVEGRLLSAVSAAEIKTYLQNVLLRDADQMGMAVALEIREPFLDHQLVEFVMAVKDDFKFHTTPKKLLVDSVGGLLPPELVNRPKMGFLLPWSRWMKNELKEFSQNNLQSLSEKGFMDKKELLQLYSSFQHGDASVTWSRLWHLITLNQWIDEHKVSW